MTLGKYKKFGGKMYTNQGGTTSKAKATQVAKGFRTIGQAARVYNDPGTSSYYVYTR